MVMPDALASLDAWQRRKLLARTGAFIVLVWVVLFTAYFLDPISNVSDLSPLIRLVVGSIVIVIVLSWETTRILRAEHPEVRAVEALGTVIPLFLVIFSIIYLSMSHINKGTFSVALDHVRALYFTVTVFSTVGFGDITPHTDGARLIVAVQMLLDLVIIGVVVRIILGAAKTGRARANEAKSREAADQ